MKKSLLFLLAVTLLTYGCNNREPGLEADVEIPVSVEDIKLKSIEEFISTTGTVIPVVDVKLNAEITATYLLVNNPATGRTWQLGDKVRKGTLIASLEDAEFLNGVKLEVHELNLELTKSELEKQESLYEKGGVTLTNLKTAGYNYINAQYTVENARIQMEKTKIVSPFDGVITDLPFYTQGSEVAQGSPIVQIMDYAKMILDVNLPEKYIETVKVGQNVRITNYTLPDDTLTGKITQLSPAINSDTRTFKGNITINNPELLLRPGMFVKSDIVTARKDSVIVIPKDIILSRQRGMTVFIVNRGVANERVIATGLSNSDQVEVIRGLQVNERVVTDGFETLGQNTKVKIVK
ncbi:MAG TPA: efflux RND transporter periplasmic adaptor subunit [Bacteroidales bacterium]|nr:efflux RND transporter periplasmic adaptor subunit [Bacteroidales bacterium]